MVRPTVSPSYLIFVHGPVGESAVRMKRVNVRGYRLELALNRSAHAVWTVRTRALVVSLISITIAVELSWLSPTMPNLCSPIRN